MSEAMSDLEKDIEESRARLDRTIDRIQDRLTPAHLMDEMLGTARGTPLNGMYDSALEAVRRNPLPVLLIAAGVGMLLKGMSTKSKRSSGHVVVRRPSAVEVRPAEPARTVSPDRPGTPPERDIADRTTI